MDIPVSKRSEFDRLLSKPEKPPPTSNVKQVSRWLGHTKASFPREVYVH